MKKIIAKWLIMLALCLGAAAPAESATAKPKAGGTLNMGIYRDLEIMNPLMATTGFATSDDGNFQWSGGGLSRTWLDK